MQSIETLMKYSYSSDVEIQNFQCGKCQHISLFVIFGVACSIKNRRQILKITNPYVTERKCDVSNQSLTILVSYMMVGNQLLVTLFTCM